MNPRVNRVWVNGKFLTSDSKKIEKWKPIAKPDRVLWGTCSCGEVIYEGDAVGMRADHELVVCYACLLVTSSDDLHLDCAGLRFPDETLSQ